MKNDIYKMRPQTTFFKRDPHSALIQGSFSAPESGAFASPLIKDYIPRIEFTADDLARLHGRTLTTSTYT